MTPYNNCDKFKIVRLLIILKFLGKSNHNEDINIIFTKTSGNLKHKNNATSNNLSVKENKEDKIYTECVLPIQEVNLEADLKNVLNVETVIIKDDLEYTPPIQELTIEAVKKDIPPIEDVVIKNVSELIPPINEVNSDNIISNIPILLSEVNIDIPIESTFKLKNPALDIKAMKKELYLTNSTLLPMYENYDTPSSLSGKLFLEGFVRNKLDFSIAKAISDNIINLDTECVIIYIPFKCTTLIKYKIPPVFSKEKITDEYINCNTSPITCEIKEYKISETYTILDKEPFNKEFPIEINFHTIKENIIINLSLTLIQKQDVSIHRKDNLK